MNYYVEQKFFDSGKTVARILLESEVVGSNDEHARYAAAAPNNSYYEEHDTYDLYVDVFPTYEQAEQHYNDTLTV